MTAIRISDHIDTAMASVRRLLNVLRRLNDRTDMVPVTELARDMTRLQTEFETIMAAFGQLQAAGVDLSARPEFASDVEPPVADPAGLLDTLDAPGPALIAGQVVRIAWETQVLPAIGATDNGDGTFTLPGEVWDSATAKSRGPLPLTQAQWQPVHDALPALIAELERLGV